MRARREAIRKITIGRMRSSDNAFRVDGKIALVTGAGRGIGRAIALALADAGAEVILNSRTPAELEAVASEISGHGGRARVLPFDVTNTAAVRGNSPGARGLDLLVNNAGVNRPQPFLEVDEATLDRMIALNIKAAFIVAQSAARLMVEAGGGVIINMSSQMGHVGSERDRTVYVMTKHALEGLTKAMAAELAPKGVRVVSIAPTFITTPLTEPFFAEPRFRQWVVDRIPLGRIGTVEEVANAVVFLASPAASLVTGSSLLVDGGWTPGDHAASRPCISDWRCSARTHCTSRGTTGACRDRISAQRVAGAVRRGRRGVSGWVAGSRLCAGQNVLVDFRWAEGNTRLRSGTRGRSRAPHGCAASSRAAAAARGRRAKLQPAPFPISLSLAAICR